MGTSYELSVHLAEGKVPRSLKAFITRVGLRKPDKQTALMCARLIMEKPAYAHRFVRGVTVERVRRELVDTFYRSVA
jgi:hypothetical protein